MSDLAARLCDALEAHDVTVPAGATLRRRRGRSDTDYGLWTWWLNGPDGRPLGIGGCRPAAALLRERGFAVDTATYAIGDRYSVHLVPLPAPQDR